MAEHMVLIFWTLVFDPLQYMPFLVDLKGLAEHASIPHAAIY
jgi:hypothetical protein